MLTREEVKARALEIANAPRDEWAAMSLSTHGGPGCLVQQILNTDIPTPESYGTISDALTVGEWVALTVRADSLRGHRAHDVSFEERRADLVRFIQSL